MAQGQDVLQSKVEETLLIGSDVSHLPDARKQACVQRFTDLGLGRGIDATSSKPWLEKSSFQVRRVTFDSLVGTEEGGAVEAYEEEVSSVQSLQMGLKASVVAPTTAGPVKVGVEGEFNRSVSSNRRSVGKRVINRTIAFKEEFDGTMCKSDSGRQRQGGRSANWGFEERLMVWILESLENDHEELCSEGLTDKLEGGECPAALFREWYKGHASSLSREAVEQALISLCYDFVGHYHITHYVCCLRLGALDCCVLSEREFYRSVSQTTTVGVNAAETGASIKHSIKKFSKSHRSKKIGSIVGSHSEEYHVPRGTYAEAVVGVELKPISTLVHHPHLRQALTQSITRSIEVKGDASVGPFLIIAEGRVGSPIYLTVELSDMTLQGTTSKSLASPFVIMSSDEKPYDFHIMYINESGNNHKKSVCALFSSRHDGQRPLSYYLTARLNILGHSRGPLQLEVNPRVGDTLFHLHSRLRTSHPSPEDLGPWVNGKEAFFLNCHGRKFARGGYLTVEKVVMPDGEVEHIPKCIPTRDSTENRRNIFRLVDSDEAVLAMREKVAEWDWKKRPLSTPTTPGKEYRYSRPP